MRKSPDNALAGLHSPQQGGARQERASEPKQPVQAAGTPPPTLPVGFVGEQASVETNGTPLEASAVDNATIETPRAQNTESEPSSEGQRIDPAKPLVFVGPDGKEERLTWEELQAQRFNYSKYMSERSKLDAEKKKVEEDKRAAETALSWQDKAARSPFMGVYLQRIAGGASEAEATQAAIAAASAAGYSTPVQQEKKGPPKPPNNDPTSDEYMQWYDNEYIPYRINQAAEEKVEAMLAQRLAPIENELKGYKEQTTRTAEEVNARTERQQRNEQEINQFANYAYQMKGVIFSQLSPEEQNEFGVQLTQAFIENDIDIRNPEVLASRDIHPDSVKYAVRTALDRFAKKPAPVKARTQQDPPLNAAPSAGASNYTGGTRPRGGYAPRPIAALNNLHKHQ